MTEEFAVQRDGDRATISLPAVLDLAAADKLWTACAEAHENGLSLMLDGREVERLSTGCAQVMLSAWKTQENGGLVFSLSAPSEAMRNGLEDLGLTDILKKWSTE